MLLRNANAITFIAGYLEYGAVPVASSTAVMPKLQMSAFELYPEIYIFRIVCYCKPSSRTKFVSLCYAILTATIYTGPVRAENPSVSHKLIITGLLTCSTTSGAIQHGVPTNVFLTLCFDLSAPLTKPVTNSKI